MKRISALVVALMIVGTTFLTGCDQTSPPVDRDAPADHDHGGGDHGGAM